MYEDRLERLAKLLEVNAGNQKGVRFDMGFWASPISTSLFDGNWADKVEVVPMNCNTIACAMGLAAISGEFKAEGLTYEFVESLFGGGFILVPKFENKGGFKAAEMLFDINPEDADYLFDPSSYDDYPSKGAEGELFVAKRIREFIAGNIDENCYHYH